MFWIENIWTHIGFQSDSYAEACFFAKFDTDYIVVERASMHYVVA